MGCLSCAPKSRLWMALLAGIALLVSGSAFADSLAELQPEERNTVEIFQRYGPSVVAIDVSVSGKRIDPFESIPDEMLPPHLREFFERHIPQGQQRQAPRREGAGSGFVIDDDGHIVTNYHVLRPALRENDTELRDGAEVKLSFPGHDAVEAEVVGANALYDLALLKPADSGAIPDDVEPIPIGNSEELMVGQKTIAIGNPFGLSSTVTSGIVSAVGRDIPGVGQLDIPMIQTDAAINPGNSGGPLLNSAGELVGINTAIIPGGGGMGGKRGFIGVGFAVPSKLLQESLGQLREGGLTDLSSRARLGVTIAGLDGYPAAIRERLNLPKRGAMVVEVEEGSPADEAGLRGASFQVSVQGRVLPADGDIILGVDGEQVEAPRELQRMIFSQARSAGDEVTLDILRRGKRMQIKVELRKRERTSGSSGMLP